MHGYYEERLAADRLKRCYDLAPPRVEQYLRAEVDFVVEQLRPTDAVLGGTRSLGTRPTYQDRRSIRLRGRRVP